MEQTYIRTVITSADKIKNIVGLKSEGKIPKCSHIIYFDIANPDYLVSGRAAGLTLVSYE